MHAFFEVLVPAGSILPALSLAVLRNPFFFFTLPCHRHVTFQLVNHFHWFGSQKKKKYFPYFRAWDERSSALAPPGHICSRAAPQVSAPRCLPSPDSPGFLFRLCCCWSFPTSASGGHSPHCLGHVAILVYATSFFSASAVFMRLPTVTPIILSCFEGLASFFFFF